MNKITRILLDMDELLSDFVGGACGLYGKTKEDVYRYWTPGRWEMDEPLSRATGEPVTIDSFWRKIDETPGFWHYLPELPWMMELIHVVEVFETKYDLKRWNVVTSPGKDPGCYLGKATWLKKKFGRDFDRFAITPHKELFAQPGVILIDDRESNIENFIKNGGQGILSPAHHNRLHEKKSNPVRFIVDSLYSIFSK